MSFFDGRNLAGLVHPAPAVPVHGSSLLPVAAAALALVVVVLAVAFVAARR